MGALHPGFSPHTPSEFIESALTEVENSSPRDVGEIETLGELEPEEVYYQSFGPNAWVKIPAWLECVRHHPEVRNESILGRLSGKHCNWFIISGVFEKCAHCGKYRVYLVCKRGHQAWGRRLRFTPHCPSCGVETHPGALLDPECVLAALTVLREAHTVN